GTPQPTRLALLHRFSGPSAAEAEKRRDPMLLQSMIAATLALAAVAASPTPSAAAPLQNGSGFEATTLPPGAEANAVHQGSPANARHHRVVLHRTIVHHVYRYEPAPTDYGDYPPSYAPPPVAALPAAACIALSLLGAC